MRTKQGKWDNLLEDPQFKQKCDRWTANNSDAAIDDDVGVLEIAPPFILLACSRQQSNHVENFALSMLNNDAMDLN